jgi:hypothetical protein
LALRPALRRLPPCLLDGIATNNVRARNPSAGLDAVAQPLAYNMATFVIKSCDRPRRDVYNPTRVSESSNLNTISD